jgi:hypothetical protein
METKKIDSYTIEVTKQPVVEPIVHRYDRGFIERQIVSIQAQKDTYAQARQAELDECNAILAEMDKLEIVKKEENIIKEEI